MSNKSKLLQLTWIIPLTIIACAVALLLSSSFSSYNPFVFKSYDIKPKSVCTNGDVVAFVTRKYTEDFKSLTLIETWISVHVPGLDSNLPVQQNSGTLPEEALKNTHGFTTVKSPLLDKAPQKPGIYKVRIKTESHGTRWGFVPAVGTSTHYSTDNIIVKDCNMNKSKGDK